MFASQRVPRSYNHYMLSTPSFKRGACAGFEHPSTAPVPLVPQGRASRPVFHRSFAACRLRPTGGGTRPLFTGLLQSLSISNYFQIFFGCFLLTFFDENWHGELFRLGYIFLTMWSAVARGVVYYLIWGCHVDPTALSWCCRIVLYIYDENSTLGLKKAYTWQ